MRYINLFILFFVSLNLNAEYNLHLKLNYPFESEKYYEDTVMIDSSAVDVKVQAALSGIKGKIAVLEDTTDRYGYAHFYFKYWSDGSIMIYKGGCCKVKKYLQS